VMSILGEPSIRMAMGDKTLKGKAIRGTWGSSPTAWNTWSLCRGSCDKWLACWARAVSLCLGQNTTRCPHTYTVWFPLRCLSSAPYWESWTLRSM
jgi:hypothetical protein